MSRAFVKEDGPDVPQLPDLPQSPHPNWVTPQGLQQLQDRLAAARADLARLRARAERLDLMPEAAVERDIRWIEARLRTAIPVDIATHDLTEVAFGLLVTVADADGAETTFRIVGEDEAAPARGLITPQSPLARALIGARVGDSVTWRRPTGATELEVLRIDRPDPQP